MNGFQFRRLSGPYDSDKGKQFTVLELVATSKQASRQTRVDAT